MLRVASNGKSSAVSLRWRLSRRSAVAVNAARDAINRAHASSNPIHAPNDTKCANAQRIAGFDPPRVVSHLLKMFLQRTPTRKMSRRQYSAMYRTLALPSKTLFFPRQARNLVSSLHRQQLSVLSPEPRNNPALSKRLTAFRQCDGATVIRPSQHAESWMDTSASHPRRPRLDARRLAVARRTIASFSSLRAFLVVDVVVRRRRHRPFSKSVLLWVKKVLFLFPTEPLVVQISRPPKELCDDNTDDDDDATKTTTTVVETTSVSPPPTPPRYKNGFCFSAGA